MKSSFKLIFLNILLYIFQTGFAQQEMIQSEELFSMSLEELLNVKIFTAGKIEQKVSEVPASVVLISREEIERIGYLSVEEILQNVPGFYLIDDYTWLGQKNYGVRGFFSTGQFDHVSVLINGVSQKSSLLDSYPTEIIAIPVEAIDRIEVIRGPMSVMYGSGAFFGAINIITNDTESFNRNKITVSAGNQGMHKLYAGFRQKGDEFSYSFYGAQYNDNGIDVPFSKMITNASIVAKPVDQGGWNLDSNRTKNKLGTNRRHFSFSGSYKDLTVDFNLINNRKNVIETIAGFGNGSWMHFNNSQFSVKYTKNLSPSFSLEGKFKYADDHHWVDNEFYYKNSYTNNLLRSNYFETEIIARYHPSERLSLLSGIYHNSIFDYVILVDYIGLGYLPNLEITYNDDIINSSFYSQLEYSFSKKLRMTAGFRIERLHPYKFDLNRNDPEAKTLGSNQPPDVTHGEFKPRHYFEFIPRFALLYSPNNKNVLKVLYGKAIKQPNPTSNLDVAYNDSLQLKPASIQTLEINYLASISSKIHANISVFRNQLDNLISRKNLLTDEASVIISTNAGKMSTTGIEANLQYQLSSNLKTDFSITWQHSKDQRKGFEDIKPGYAPQVLAYGKVIWDISKPISFSLSARYIDKMDAGWNMENLSETNLPTVPDGDLLEGRLGHEIKSNFTLDCNLRIRELFKSNLFLNVRVSNLFDEEIYYPTTTSNPLFDKGTMGQGRTALITLGWNF